MRHKHADALIALSEGKEIEVRANSLKGWFTPSEHLWVDEPDKWEVRIKEPPETKEDIAKRYAQFILSLGNYEPEAIALARSYLDLVEELDQARGEVEFQRERAEHAESLLVTK